MARLALLPLLFVDGAAMGLVMAPLISSVLTGLPAVHAGSAAGLLQSVQQFANALGVALIGMVYFGTVGAAATPVTSADAFASCLMCLAILALALVALVRRLR